MKTILLIIAIACSLSGLMAQTPEPLLDTTKKWTDVAFSSAKDIKTGRSSTYKLSGIEQIAGYEYFKLFVSENDPEFSNWTIYGYMRETADGKVYLIDYGQTQEFILFDFSLNVGDSLVVDEYRTFLIDSIKNEFFAGKVRRHLYFKIRQEPYWTGRWIEGVGSNYGFINGRYVGFVGGDWTLLCFEQNGELLYHNQVNYGEGIIEDCFYEAGWPWESILTVSKKWTDLEYSIVNNALSYHTAAYKIGGNITLDGRVYKILSKSVDSLNLNWEVIGYLRQYFYNRLYFRKQGEPIDQLIYYFTTYGTNTIDFGGHGIILTSYEFKEFAGQYRWHMYGHTFPNNRPDTIIEGIGSITSGFLGVLHAGLGNNSNHLLCFSENDQLLYHCPMNIAGSGVIEGCYFNNTDIEPFISEERGFQIVPNPVESTGIIKIKENQMFPLLLEVFTLDGFKALEVRIYKPEQEISFSSLSMGIYICRIKLNDKTLTSKLLLK